MKPSIQKLQKFFRLEAERGYDNRAVLGGLENIVDSWEAEARVDQLPEDLIQTVRDRLHDYARLSSTSRAEALEGIWRRIQRRGEAPASASPVQEDRPARADTPPAENREISIEQQFEDLERSRTISENLPENAVAPESAPLPREPVDTNLKAESEYPIAPDLVSVSPRPVKQEEAPVALNAPVTVLPGVGPRHATTLSHLGLQTLRDLLYYFPRRYDDYSQLKPINRLEYGEEVTVIGTVQSATTRNIRGGQAQIAEAVISDGSGVLRVSWFNQPWVARRLRAGAQISVAGKIDQYLGRLTINNPEWEPLEQQQLSTNRIAPVYPLTANITQRWLRRLMGQVVPYWAQRVRDPLPEQIRRSAGLVDLTSALTQAHFPDSMERLKAARHRLAFDEIFLLQLGVLRQKYAWQERTAQVFDTTGDWLEDQVARLPFALTGAQRRALLDVKADLASGRPMNRLLQGDVGSGKTVIAALAIAMVTRHGAQAALMAPTSILAEQHYKSMLALLASNEAPPPAAQIPLEIPVVEQTFMEGPLSSDLEQPHEPGPAVDSEQPIESGPAADTEPETGQPQVPEMPATPRPPAPLEPSEIRLMIGATPEAEKQEIRAGLAEGKIKLVVGTHALIEEPVTFSNLELTIVDEQHRFGVEQRAALRSKGTNPHLLVMTATPIPRSLALTVYGDLDLAVIDEMPPGRQPVSTHVLTPRERERAYSLIRSQVEKGRQAFIIYPLVEESEKSDSKAAVEEYTRLQSTIFPKLRLGLLHGRMRPDEKDEVMGRFRAREIHVLVSTSVVEVGMDIPNATVMLIEGADHFGLAQLHQFRGRVGRSAEKSYCLLIPDTNDAVENERLLMMTQTNDGFVLAQRDLEQRGPGEFLGTRQAGFTELQMASLTDITLVEKARRQAQALFEQDRNLDRPEHQPIAAELVRFWGQSSGGDIS